MTTKKTQSLVLLERNPRTISDEKFSKLKYSISNFPEMLKARPIVINQRMEVLGGNMRVRAARELGIEELPCIQVDWTEERQKQFIIKDNVGFGDWDWDILANEWDEAEIASWGLDVWQPEEDAVKELQEEEYNFGENWYLSIELADEKQTNEWYNKLMAEGLKVKIVQ